MHDLHGEIVAYLFHMEVIVVFDSIFQCHSFSRKGGGFAELFTLLLGTPTLQTVA